MAQRRMFSLEVVNTDAFLDLPASSQALYFHLGMRADDDGFVSNPKKITALVNCSPDDLSLLIAKGFIIPFPSGVIVVRDWKTNNYIQADRYHETRYLEEKGLLSINKNGSYSIPDTSCIQNVYKLDTEDRLGKDRLGEDIIERKAGKPPHSSRFVPPSVEEVRAYCQERQNRIDPERFVDFYVSKGWKIGNQSMKDWKAAVRTWEKRDRSDGKAASPDIRDPKNYTYSEGESL